MDKKMTGIIGYITPIGFLLAFITGDKEGAKFHLNQGLVLSVLEVVLLVAMKVVSMVLGILGALGGIVTSLLGAVVSIACIALIVIGVLNAAKEADKELPIIGGIRILK